MVDNVENMANNLLKNSETILNRALDNNYINVSLKILLGLYAALYSIRTSVWCFLGDIFFFGKRPPAIPNNAFPMFFMLCVCVCVCVCGSGHWDCLHGRCE